MIKSRRHEDAQVAANPVDETVKGSAVVLGVAILTFVSKAASDVYDIAVKEPCKWAYGKYQNWKNTKPAAPQNPAPQANPSINPTNTTNNTQQS